MARKLTIDVEVNDAGAIRKLGKVEGNLKGIQSSGVQAGKSVGAMSGAMRTAVGTFTGFVTGTAVLQGVSAAFRFAAGAAIGMNASIETTTLQFKTLIGNSADAEEHVRSLFNFAKRTPFESGPIIEASRIMRTFGGATLDTTANLTLIGDAAAATGAPINELGMWTGRLYAQLQAGKPFGEAAQRLSELAVLTPQARMEMEALQESGASGQEIFAAFKGELERFNGASDAMAETWEGLTSTFWESAKIMIADRTVGAFNLLKSAIKGANKALDVINQGPIRRAARQLDDLNIRQREASILAARQYEQMGRVDERLAFQIETRGRLIAEIKASNAELEAAEQATEDETRAVVDNTAAVQRAKEEADKFAESVEGITRAQLRSLAVTQNHLRATVSMGDAYREESGRLDAYVFGIDLAGERVQALGRDFSGLRDKIDQPGGFFKPMMDSFEGLKSGLSGENGLVGFFTKMGTGIVEGFGNIISGGLTGLVDSLVSFLASKIGEFLGWLGSKIGGFFKAIGRGLGRLFGVGGNDAPPIVPGTPEHEILLSNPGNLIDPETPGMSRGGLVPTPQQFARGGAVSYLAGGGRPRGTDTVPAMLTPGEFVMSRPAVNRIGAGRLAAMNSGAGGGGVNVTVNVNGGYMDSPITQRKLANLVESQLLRSLGQRRNVAGLV